MLIKNGFISKLLTLTTTVFLITHFTGNCQPPNVPSDSLNSPNVPKPFSLYPQSSQHSSTFGSWSELIESESICKDSQFITVELFLGVSRGSAGIITRWARTCAQSDTPVYFDTLSRHMILLQSTPELGGFLTHPHFQLTPKRWSFKILHKAVSWMLKIVQAYLGQVEDEIIQYILNPDRMMIRQHRPDYNITISMNERMPLKCNFQIPILIGDSSLFSDVNPFRHRYFYALVRLAINTYKSHYGLVFYTTPNYATHISAAQKLAGDYAAIFPKVISSVESHFLEAHHRQHVDRSPATPLVFIGLDTSAFMMEISDTTRFEDAKLGDYKTFSLLSVGGKSKPFIAIPFMNLGAQRALAILHKTYCEQNAIEGICYLPCQLRGWVQPCHGGSGIAGSPGRFRLFDSFRPSWYCDNSREEMKLSRYLHLCLNTLRYDIKDIFAPSRSKIKNCALIVGTGNAAQCESAIRKGLMTIQLPYSGEAADVGFSNPGSVKRLLDEPLSRVSVTSTYHWSFRALTRHSSLRSKNEYHDISIPFDELKKASRTACLNELFSHNKSETLSQNLCFEGSFLIELLKAFGAHSSTNVTILYPFFYVRGVLQSGLESDPQYLHDFFALGSNHWRDATLKSVPQYDTHQY